MIFFARVCFGCSGSSVIDFGTHRKRICDFLLVHHSNLVLSCTVSEILQAFALMTSPLFHLFWGVPVAPYWGQPEHKP